MLLFENLNKLKNTTFINLQIKLVRLTVINACLKITMQATVNQAQTFFG